MATKINWRVIVIYLLAQVCLFQKAKSQQSQGQIYKQQVEDNARRESEKQNALNRSQKSSNVLTGSGKTDNNKPANSNTDIPNIDKGINELINHYREGAWELRQTASNCINSIGVYQEVKFISPYSRSATNYADQKLQKVNYWSKEQLETGYLLKTKSNDKYVVAVWKATNLSTGWGFYLVTCVTDNTSFSSPVSFNIGNSWSEINNLVNVGNFTYFSSELEAIDKAIPIELKRIADEKKKKDEDEKKKKDEAKQLETEKKLQSDADDEMHTPKGEKINNGLYTITSDGVTFAGLFSQSRLTHGLRTDKNENGHKEFYTKIRNNKFASDQIDIYSDGSISIVYGPGNFNSLTSTEAEHIYVYKNGTIQYAGNRGLTGASYFPDGSMFLDPMEGGVGNPSINNFSGNGALYRADGFYENCYFINGKKNGTTSTYNPNGDGWRYEYKRGVKLDSKTKKINTKENSLYFNYGKIPYTNGDLFTGQYNLNAQNGNKEPYTGTIKFKNGDRFCGNFMEEVCEGIMKLKNGSTIYGWFKKSISNGIITISGLGKDSESPCIKISSQKDVYVGFVNENFEISYNGDCFYNNGDIYSGLFEKDIRSIGGLLIYKNGDVYNGRFENDKPNGSGGFVNAISKEKFTGTFRDGLRDGEGTLLFADGTSKKVKYINGVLQQ
ncbi:MAG: hypothetical protein ACRDEB_08800 [Chitinophagaceae bacterium]